MVLKVATQSCIWGYRTMLYSRFNVIRCSIYMYMVAVRCCILLCCMIFYSKFNAIWRCIWGCCVVCIHFALPGWYMIYIVKYGVRFTVVFKIQYVVLTQRLKIYSTKTPFFHTIYQKNGKSVWLKKLFKVKNENEQ